jgi:hypothetical protein
LVFLLKKKRKESGVCLRPCFVQCPHGFGK